MGVSTEKQNSDDSSGDKGGDKRSSHQRLAEAIVMVRAVATE